MSVGTLSVDILEAVYDEVVGDHTPSNSYCTVRVLEAHGCGQWKLRQTAKRGSDAADEPLAPRWTEELVVPGVRLDAKVVVDVWDSPAEQPTGGRGVAAADVFLGKVSFVLDKLISAPAPEWQLLIPGRLRLRLEWVETNELDVPIGKARLLTIPGDEGVDDAQAMRQSSASETGLRAEEPSPIAQTNVLGQTARPVSMSRVQASFIADEVEELSDDSMLEQLEDDLSQPEQSAAAPLAAPQETPEVSYIEYTHCGPETKENQDALFTLRFDEKNFVFAVLDGHGGEFGRVASQAASRAMQKYLAEHFWRIKDQPEEVMAACFEDAHKAIYATIKAQEGVIERDGVLISDFSDDGIEPDWDAVDGGTTASVAALIDGEHLVFAMVGDSAAIFAIPSKQGAADEVKVTELIPEHSPTRLDEFIARFSDSAGMVVYNLPDMFDDPDCMLTVFCPDGSGSWEVDQANQQAADDQGLGFKTERGDRAAVILTPEDGPYSQMMLNMTRSIGDFYHQGYGVTWKPDVRTLRVSDLMEGSEQAVLCLASDGVWDLWTFEEAMAVLAGAPPIDEAVQRKQHVLDFYEESRSKGQEVYGDSADNLTGIAVFFDAPLGT
mmetsp:Transcript_3480/g.7852  ORF Transcript_3480/g.7852 Transcript_3480/m.7852 type:complete len:609 (-) Transcript_3480:633-2459(-)|eukprot:CAMPEP_0119368304 /NCGR_PEP_ID=MMETSP1334-20130426/14979_1 /TAXON_ID=127549 /ORGANISM="Calcidiscus leptoporus, Strain RCC1130" /LENGTH=608 /DNA_ID=CAMNT_0007384919 /DNA_START=93 /DNA_END=1919 /DNA_ORIENTATION=-